MRPRQWIGIGLGLAGIVLVLAPKLASVRTGELVGAMLPLAINVGGMVSLTLGTFYQKRFLKTGDLRSVTALQFTSSLLVTIPLALAFENFRIVFSWNTILSLAWSIGALSIVSIALLLVLLRRGEVARAAQLIYLVPPAAAVQAFFLFDERLSLVQIAGMIVTSFGVAMAIRK